MVAALFILTVRRHDTWLLYVLSGLLMVASPFFTSGRAAILPSIATREELHTANSLTQTTGWTTLTIGTFLGGASVAQFGYNWAFFANAMSFLVSALCISRLFLPGRGFRPPRGAHTEADGRAAVARVQRGAALHALRAADSGTAADQYRMGDRRRRGADSVQRLRRDRVQPRPGRARDRSGAAPASGCSAAARWRTRSGGG